MTLATLSGRNPSQNEHELTAFIAFLVESGVRRYCEIGARHGDTFHEVMRHLPVGASGVAVDLPGALWGTMKSRDSLMRSCAALKALGYNVAEPIFGNSQDHETASDVYALGPFDAVLIDADHTYRGVKRDWKLYRELAPIVAFHDIVGDDQFERVGGRPIEVPKLWAEIKASGVRVREFIAQDSKMGIGVVIADERRAPA